jgi:DNA repair protein RAD5
MVVEAGDLNVSFLFQILADAMGLGKTVMTISLILANPGRGGMDLPKVAKPSQEDPNSPSGLQLCLQEESSIQSTNQIKDSKKSRSSAQRGGGTLIVCPMTLLGQWKVRFQRSHQSLSFTCRPAASCGP